MAIASVLGTNTAEVSATMVGADIAGENRERNADDVDGATSTTVGARLMSP